MRRLYCDFPSGQRVIVSRIADILPYAQDFGVPVLVVQRAQPGRILIRNEQDLLAYFCAESINHLKKGVYKYTECGAWVEPFEGGVSFGSIVEGVERTTQTYTIHFPCDSNKIDEALKNVEEEAREIWNQTHGCETCWDGQTVFGDYGEEIGPEDYGMRPVDPDCPECQGQGVVI